MNLLVIAGRLARHRWTSGAIVAAVCRDLVRRGLDGGGGVRIRLVCQSLDDAAQFTDAQSIACYGKYRQPETDFPHGFTRWAQTQQARTPHDVCLSFSRAVAGDVWFPIKPSGAAWLRRATDTHAPHALPLAVARHNGSLTAAAREAFRRAPLRDIRRIIAIGPTSAGEAARLLTPTGLADRVVAAPFFSTLDPADADRLTDLRFRTRAVLGIPDTRPVILVSVAGAIGRNMDGLLSACAALARHDPDRAPILLVLAKECFAVHTAAIRTPSQREGAGGGFIVRNTPHLSSENKIATSIRILTQTNHIESALAAADLCALTTPAAIGQFEFGATGRFAADALRMGKPILALSGASGYDLARQTLSDSTRPGLVIESNNTAPWERALRTATDEPWLRESSAAARTLGADLTFDRFMDVLNQALTDAAAERATTPVLA